MIVHTDFNTLFRAALLNQRIEITDDYQKDTKYKGWVKDIQVNETDYEPSFIIITLELENGEIKSIMQHFNSEVAILQRGKLS